MHADMATTGFGIQEENHFSSSEELLFPDMPFLMVGIFMPMKNLVWELISTKSAPKTF